MMKMQIASAHIVKPTNMLCTHNPNSAPSSISASFASSPTMTLSMRISVSAITNPDARLTTLCATSNTAITMFHVLVTITTAHAVLNTHFASMNVSMSCMLLRSTII